MSGLNTRSSCTLKTFNNNCSELSYLNSAWLHQEKIDTRLLVTLSHIHKLLNFKVTSKFWLCKVMPYVVNQLTIFLFFKLTIFKNYLSFY